MKKKKILHIQVLPKLSGVQKVSLEIFKKLPNNYDKYILFSSDSQYGDTSECIAAFKATGAKVLMSQNLIRAISKKDFTAAKEIFNLCKKEKFDIVHTNSTKPGIIGRIAATIAGVPLVIHTIHGLAFHKFVKGPKWIFYWACEMFASLFCHKIAIVNKYYTKYFKWCKRKVEVIYNGRNFRDFPDFNFEEEKNDDFVRILFVGRLDAQKNPLFLLNVANLICKRYSNVKFTLVGDGELYNECNQYILDHELSESVTLVGWQRDVYKYYASHDILAIPSIYEAFGLIFIEAGYYKLPTVSTNVEGIPEVIEDGKTGLLSVPTDQDAFIHNLECLILNKDLRKSMGENAYNRVTTLFNSDQMVDKVINLYEYPFLQNKGVS